MELKVDKNADFKSVKIYFYDLKSFKLEVLALARMWRFYTQKMNETHCEYWFEKNRLNARAYDKMWRFALKKYKEKKNERLA